VKSSVTNNELSKCLHKQAIDQILQTPRRTGRVGNRWLRGKTYLAPPNTIAIDFLTLWSEVGYRTRLFEQWNPC